MRFKTTSRGYDLEASVRPVGPDLLVAVWGGDEPHVGAIAVARPRPGRRAGKSEAALVFGFPGHRDDVIAREAAETLAAALGRNVTVAAGAHWDRIDAAGIRRVIENNRTLVRMIIDRLSAGRQRGPRART